MLTIIRGLPGSGKSTLGRRLAAEQNALFIEPDMLMYQNGEYKYNQDAYSVAVGSTYLVLREFFAYNPQAHAIFADVLPRKIDVQHLIQYLHNQRDVKVIDMPLPLVDVVAVPEALLTDDDEPALLLTVEDATPIPFPLLLSVRPLLP